MRLIRSLVFPWIVFFLAAAGAIIVVGVKFPQYQLIAQKYLLPGLIAGSVLCIMANLRSLGAVGIWMSDSIPDSLRYGGSGRWLFRAIKAGIVAATFWFAGQLPWVPLIWNAAVIPVVFTIALFVAVFSFMGPIVKWSANLAWNRAFCTMLSLPILALVPITALFIGQTTVAAFRASKADLSVIAQEQPLPNEKIAFRGRLLSMTNSQARMQGEWPIGSGESKTVEIDLNKISPKTLASLPKSPSETEISVNVDQEAIKEAKVQAKLDKLNVQETKIAMRSSDPVKRANAIRAVYEFNKTCGDYSKEIQLSLDPAASKEVAYWAIKAVDCSDIRTVIAMPRLVQIMLDHTDPQVRAAAINAMRKYGEPNIRQISYLLVKRLSENEPPEVIQATASILAPLGADNQRWAANRLKSLLDTPASKMAAKSLIQDYKRDDLVAEYVAQHLNGAEDARRRAVDMICLLPKQHRAVADAHVAAIVSTIKTADQNDPGMMALDCMGRAGFNAIREEVTNPSKMERPTAARALAELDVKDVPEAIEVADSCSRDENDQVRKWCSQSLGQIGAAALPKILDLLESNDKSLKDSGRNALRYFDDTTAKDELQQIVTANSGWMANNKKLQIAKAVSTALAKIENSQQQPAQAPTSTPEPPAQKTTDTQ